MHSTMMYLTRLALLVVALLSIQVQVQANPIPPTNYNNVPQELYRRVEKGDGDIAVIVITAQDEKGVLEKRGDCSNVCETVYRPVTSINSKGEKRMFGNGCELRKWNCNNPGNQFQSDEPREG
ncbi:hypothetical protein BGX29_000912 [Mortierella sp. GBA35]|nr:hypothetical protein BGX29_000912 [Mortierella sp. GBA35]